MKRNPALTMALCLMLAVAVAPATEAGQRSDTKKLSPRRTEMPPEFSQAHRLDRLPAMQFQSGVLRRDGLAGWRVGDYRLELNRDTVVTGADGQVAMLQEGSRVLVMGPSYGDTFVGWTIQLLGPEPPSSGNTIDMVKKPSDSTNDVGELVSAPY